MFLFNGLYFLPRIDLCLNPQMTCALISYIYSRYNTQPIILIELAIQMNTESRPRRPSPETLDFENFGAKSRFFPFLT